jgi:formylmethanofuran dehydrogenase subunit A
MPFIPWLGRVSTLLVNEHSTHLHANAYTHPNVFSVWPALKLYKEVQVRSRSFHSNIILLKEITGRDNRIIILLHFCSITLD